MIARLGKEKKKRKKEKKRRKASNTEIWQIKASFVDA
jgi:hypothetical protein